MRRDRLPRREPLTGEETDALIHACRPGAERLVVLLLLDTGIRVAEAAGLTDSAVDWHAARFTVRGKGNKRRVVPMSERVRELLGAWFALHEQLPARRTMQKILRRVAGRTRIRKPVSPHVLRHTFTVTALKRGLPAWAVQRILGHERLATTEIYAAGLAPEDAINEYRKHMEGTR